MKLKLTTTTRTLTHIGQGMKELAVTLDGDGSGRPSALLWKEPSGERLLMATAEEIERLAALVAELRYEADHRDHVYAHDMVCVHHGYYSTQNNGALAVCPQCETMRAAEEAAEEASAGFVTEAGKKFLDADTAAPTTTGKAA